MRFLILVRKLELNAQIKNDFFLFEVKSKYKKEFYVCEKKFKKKKKKIQEKSEVNLRPTYHRLAFNSNFIYEMLFMACSLYLS